MIIAFGAGIAILPRMSPHRRPGNAERFTKASIRSPFAEGVRRIDAIRRRPETGWSPNLLVDMTSSETAVRGSPRGMAAAMLPRRSDSRLTVRRRLLFGPSSAASRTSTGETSGSEVSAGRSSMNQQIWTAPPETRSLSLRCFLCYGPTSVKGSGRRVQGRPMESSCVLGASPPDVRPAWPAVSEASARAAACFNSPGADGGGHFPNSKGNTER